MKNTGLKMPEQIKFMSKSDVHTIRKLKLNGLVQEGRK